MARSEKGRPRFTGQLVVRAWIEVPLTAKNLEEARVELDQIKMGDVVTVDGEVLDFCLEPAGVTNQTVIDKVNA